MNNPDVRPFPVFESGEAHGFIPWWLAQEAYVYYVDQFGSQQSLERIAERGGFGRRELLMLLRRDLSGSDPAKEDHDLRDF